MTELNVALELKVKNWEVSFLNESDKSDALEFSNCIEPDIVIPWLTHLAAFVMAMFVIA